MRRVRPVAPSRLQWVVGERGVDDTGRGELGSCGVIWFQALQKSTGGARRSRQRTSRRTACSAVLRVLEADADNLEVVPESRARVSGDEGRESRIALVAA